ncbi:MAG: tRNA (adenosine(37)-N6)-dimethylallyltransferase MiaA [Rickettsiaceae bacterium]|nr:tRNA (adenosine(37)-N6)-dimethylallyltransferase MiaA [Rickettsiaceae bacterium]
MTAKHKLIILIGPTASGKSSLALKIAQKFSKTPIVNADAFQVYKDLQIITSSPTNEDKIIAPHYLYNYLDIGACYSVAKYIQDVNKVLLEISQTSNFSILVGGSHMYIYNLLYGLDDIPTTDKNISEQSEKLLNNLGKSEFYQLLSELDPKIIGIIGPSDTQRMLRAYNVKKQTGVSIIDFRKKQENISSNFLSTYDTKIIALNPERTKLYKNCDARVEFMFNNGAIEEVGAIIAKNDNISNSTFKAIGFDEIKSYLNKNLSYDEALNTTKQRTRNYAKRQVTWCKNKFDNKTTHDSSYTFADVELKIDSWLNL